tara:strand:- start:283 stop:474 length:192 start_codon:yes stop_codon:yes gene_type:complete
MANTTPTDWMNDKSGQVLRNQTADFIASLQIQYSAYFGFGTWVPLSMDAVVENGYIVTDQDNN